jgi:hypothetical protein
MFSWECLRGLVLRRKEINLIVTITFWIVKLVTAQLTGPTVLRLDLIGQEYLAK